MSLVGPRPERPFYVEQFGRTVPHYDARHRAPVGLTGWAQIHGLRGNSSIDDRVRFADQTLPKTLTPVTQDEPHDPRVP